MDLYYVTAEMENNVGFKEHFYVRAVGILPALITVGKHRILGYSSDVVFDVVSVVKVGEIIN